MQYLKSLIQKLRQKYGKIQMDDPRMSELIEKQIKRRAVLMALKEGKQK